MTSPSSTPEPDADEVAERERLLEELAEDGAGLLGRLDAG